MKRDENNGHKLCNILGQNSQIVFVQQTENAVYTTKMFQRYTVQQNDERRSNHLFISN